MSHAESCDFALKVRPPGHPRAAGAAPRPQGGARAGHGRGARGAHAARRQPHSERADVAPAARAAGRAHHGRAVRAGQLAASALTLLRFRLADTLIQATGGRPAVVLPAGPPRVQRTATRARAAPGTLAAPLLAFVGLAAAYGAVAGAVVVFGAPQAAGSGLAEMRCGAAAVSPVARSSSLRCAASGASAPPRRAYFNGVHVSGLLSLRTMAAKLVSAVFVLSAGLVAEGAAPARPTRRAARRPPGKGGASGARARRRVPVRARGRHRGRRPGRPGVQARPARPPCERPAADALAARAAARAPAQVRRAGDQGPLAGPAAAALWGLVPRRGGARSPAARAPRRAAARGTPSPRVRARRSTAT